MKPLLRKHWSTIIVFLALILFSFTTLFFYPGYMTTDSMWQLCQMLGDCQLDSWHPVSMALVWRVLYVLSGDRIGSMLIFQMCMLWTSIAILSFYAWKTTRRQLLSLIPFAIALLPNIIGLSGVIWKDLQMAHALILSVSLILLIRLYRNKRTLVWTLASISLVFITYAVTVRTNAIAAAIPVLFALIYSLGITKKAWIIASTTIVLSGILFTINPIINSTGKNRIDQNHAQVTMYLYDTTFIYPRQKLQETSPVAIRDVLLQFSECSYLNTTPPQTTLAWWKCVDQDTLTALSLDKDRYGALKAFWRHAIMSHPAQYALGKTLTSFMFLFPDTSQPITGSGIPRNNRYNLNTKFPASISITNSYMIDFGHQNLPFLFQGWFWLTVSIAAIVHSVRHKLRHKWIVLALAASSLLNILSLLPGSLTPDYRYIYWSSLASLAALLLVYIDRHLSNKKVAKRYR